MKTLTAIILILTLITGAILAQVPNLFNYQGRLTDAEGTPLDGNFVMQFTLYNEPEEGEILWTSEEQEVKVTKGLFNYILGQNSPLPEDLTFNHQILYLGITIEGEEEIIPRVQLTSAAFSQSSGFAWNIVDNAVTENKIANNAVTGPKIASNSINTTHIQNGTISLDDIGQNGAVDGETIVWNSSTLQWEPVMVGTGDITGVTAGTGLTGGGTSGDIALAIAPDGVTTSEIENYTIYDSDISSSANILPSKISGTAVNLDSEQTITAEKIFAGNVRFGDSTLLVTSERIRIGEGESINDHNFVRVSRNFNTGEAKGGIRLNMYNSGTGVLGGIDAHTLVTSGSGASDCVALGGYAYNNGNRRIGVSAFASSYSYPLGSGSSYGILSSAYEGAFNYGVYGIASDATSGRYGIYGTCNVSDGDYGGYFYGNLHSTGTNTKGGGGYKIDHPQDPENMYLMHSDVSSPDMMNIYSGNVVTDSRGIAEVQLPEYFESLNTDYRYQLTVIGSFAQAIVSEEIRDNRFTIETDRPNVKVSWQVTGIRNDAFARKSNLDVESVKEADKQGRYLHPELFGFGIEQAVDYENHKNTTQDSNIKEVER